MSVDICTGCRGRDDTPMSVCEALAKARFPSRRQQSVDTLPGLIGIQSEYRNTSFAIALRRLTDERELTSCRDGIAEHCCLW